MSITVATLQTSHARVAHVAHMTLAARAFTLGGRCMQVLFQHASWTMSDAAFYNTATSSVSTAKWLRTSQTRPRDAPQRVDAVHWVGIPLGYQLNARPLSSLETTGFTNPGPVSTAPEQPPETQAQAQVQAERGTGGGRGI
eukprot:CAMPEP_0174351216 /NCGR_PEP_ID=MMETSP0811_2-20130205/8512_1 /TAXON_ID=73025 ORGANISM="Eutreptiella gymnastica-like, Strain CCMP1594" /NCGR_SAMPLE_ID=MMETSP0811_2 /ASSEMBLY_ACC=CAM_ASM_000667 /LENGTH=140 /DNA_ID=CAMNT_0015480221 /DNA_START=81 /DNA_END=500 /DNA_ORIENTATION=+